ncbi:MAG: diaminopimelate epimerase [Muribaculaceae bacterium]
MMIRFTKMHGAGNDYIYINAIDSCPANLPELSNEMSDRHKGVGSDGVVLIMPSDKADFRMRMFNADGSEGEMCGNASRCVAKYVYDKGLTSKRKITLETLAGIKVLEITKVVDEKVREVKVDMGEPSFAPENIPTKSNCEVIDIPISTSLGTLNLTAVGTGNPHGVVIMDSVSDLDIDSIGPEIQNNELFPRKANIEFVRIINRNEIEMRVYERGSGETMACGTGACASVVATSRLGLTDRRATVHLKGGDLQIHWAENNHVYMTGEAATVFEGEYERCF